MCARHDSPQCMSWDCTVFRFQRIDDDMHEFVGAVRKANGLAAGPSLNAKWIEDHWRRNALAAKRSDEIRPRVNSLRTFPVGNDQVVWMHACELEGVISVQRRVDSCANAFE